jgi:hypothetical protein
MGSSFRETVEARRLEPGMTEESHRIKTMIISKDEKDVAGPPRGRSRERSEEAKAENKGTHDRVRPRILPSRVGRGKTE